MENSLGFMKKDSLEKTILCAERLLGKLRDWEIVVTYRNTEAMQLEIRKKIQKLLHR